MFKKKGNIYEVNMKQQYREASETLKKQQKIIHQETMEFMTKIIDMMFKAIKHMSVGDQLEAFKCFNFIISMSNMVKDV